MIKFLLNLLNELGDWIGINFRSLIDLDDTISKLDNGKSIEKENPSKCTKKTNSKFKKGCK